MRLKVLHFSGQIRAESLGGSMKVKLYGLGLGTILASLIFSACGGTESNGVVNSTNANRMVNSANNSYIASNNQATPQPSRTVIAVNTQTPTLTPTPTPENLADRIRRVMPKGNVVYDPPATMNLEETKLVNLMLGPTKTVEELVKMIPDRQGRQIQSDNVQWHGYMQAEMTGTDFDITPVTSAKQLVSEQELTKWSWSIKPKKPGKQTLYLTLYALVDEGGAEKPLVIRPFDPKEIVVDITLYQRAGLVLATVGSHMEWVLTAIIGLFIPFTLWVRNRAKVKDNVEQANLATAKENTKAKDNDEVKDDNDEVKDEAEPKSEPESIKPKKVSKPKSRKK